MERFLALAKKYTDFSELTTSMINEFIDTTAYMNFGLFAFFSVRRLLLCYHLNFLLWLKVINDGLMFLWWCFIRLSFSVVGKIKYKIGKPFLE